MFPTGQLQIMQHAVIISKIKTKSQKLLFSRTVSHQLDKAHSWLQVGLCCSSKHRVLLLHRCVLYFKLYVTQQWTLLGLQPAVPSSAVQLSLPNSRTSFTAQTPVLPPPSQTYRMTQSKCVQGHHSPLLGRPLLWDAHHPPSALRQSLPERKALFCLLSTYNLGSFSIQTCEIVPVDEAVTCKLQAPSINSRFPPSCCKGGDLTPKC